MRIVQAAAWLGWSGAAAMALAAGAAMTVVPPAEAPISYFNANCASCHGNYGAFYGDGFAKDLTDEQLREVVEEMAAGPAQAPLEGEALAAQIAYHRSLVDGRPFLTAAKDGAGLRGEVTPGATVVVKTAAGDVDARVDGHTWTAPAAGDEVVATKGDHTTRLKTADRHSHPAP